MGVAEYRIRRGLPATLATVELIRRAIVDASKDLAVRARAIRIVRAAGVPAKDYRGELQAIFDYCCHKLRYTRDPVTAELVHAAPRLLGEIDQRGATAGDCDDQSVLLGALAASIGFPVAIRIIGPRPGEFRHVHLRVQVGGRWIPADLTACPRHGLGFEARAPVERVFLLDGREITGMRYVGTLAGLGQGVFSEQQIAHQVGALGFSRYDITPDGQVMGYGSVDDLGGLFDFVTAPFKAAGKAIGQVASVGGQLAPLVGMVNPAAGAAMAAGARAGQMASGILSTGGRAPAGGGRAPAGRAPAPGPRPAPAQIAPSIKPSAPRSMPQPIYRTSKPTAAGAGPASGSFFTRYKWPLLIGGVAVVGGGAYLLTRKKGRR